MSLDTGPTAVGPKLILPSEWLPVIWGGEEQFALKQRNNELTAAQLLRLSVNVLGRWGDVWADGSGEGGQSGLAVTRRSEPP